MVVVVAAAPAAGSGAAAAAALLLPRLRRHTPGCSVAVSVVVAGDGGDGGGGGSSLLPLVPPLPHRRRSHEVPLLGYPSLNRTCCVYIYVCMCESNCIILVWHIYICFAWWVPSSSFVFFPSLPTSLFSFFSAEERASCEAKQKNGTCLPAVPFFQVIGCLTRSGQEAFFSFGFSPQEILCIALDRHNFLLIVCTLI